VALNCSRGQGKGWGPGAVGAVYTNRSYRSTTPGPYGLLLVGQPNVVCRAPSSACEPRWTLEMVADAEVDMACLQPAVVAGPAPATVLVLTCNTSK